MLTSVANGFLSLTSLHHPAARDVCRDRVKVKIRWSDPAELPPYFAHSAGISIDRYYVYFVFPEASVRFTELHTFELCAPCPRPNLSGIIYEGKLQREWVSLWGKEINCSIQLTMKTGFYSYTERHDRNRNKSGV